MSLPFAPLAAKVGLVYAVEEGHRNTGHLIETSVVGAVAIACEVDPTTARRWQQLGLSLVVAERAAEMIGCHPVDIWSDWCEYVLAVSPDFDPHSLGPPEEERPGYFAGRKLDFRAIGRARYYGLHGDLTC